MAVVKTGLAHKWKAAVDQRGGFSVGRQVYCKNVICDTYAFVCIVSGGDGNCDAMNAKESSTEPSANGTELSNRTSTIFSIGPDYMTQW
jgi:hypothetical protein